MKDPMSAAASAAEEAGRLLLTRFGRSPRVRSKGLADIVTASDTASERLIRRRLTAAFPGIPILGEEGGGPSGFSDIPRLWVIDPLDGTVNFAHGNPVFSVSIALVESGLPVAGVVHDPTRRETFRAARGRGAWLGRKRLETTPRRVLPESLLSTGFSYQRGKTLDRSLVRFRAFHHAARAVRRPGSAALDLAYVAAGRFDGFWETGLKPWDVAAGWLLVEEAGGRVTGFRGRPYCLGTADILASNSRLHLDMLKTLTLSARPVRRPRPRAMRIP